MPRRRFFCRAITSYPATPNISSAKANRRIAEYNRQQVELDAVREIRGYLNQLREARERLAVASENVLRAEEDLRLAIEKFRVGAGTILDRITAESDLTTTRSEVVTAVVDYLVAQRRASEDGEGAAAALAVGDAGSRRGGSPCVPSLLRQGRLRHGLVSLDSQHVAGRSRTPLDQPARHARAARLSGRRRGRRDRSPIQGPSAPG